MRLRLPVAKRPQRFNIILADPPWTFKVWNKDTGSGRSPSAHYSCLTLEDIKAVPVNSIAEKDCVLFLWACAPSFPEALEIVKAWGFKYKTFGFAWFKKTKNGKRHVGMGYWTRANVEICILATKGNPKRISAAVQQVIEAPVLAHSEKPAEIHSRIVELLGDLPRCELFARTHTPGWCCMGLELSGKDIREEIAEFTSAEPRTPHRRS